MGDEYIKKEDAVKAVANAYWHGTDCECYAFAHKALGNVPSADVVPMERYKSMENTCVKLQKSIADAAPVRHETWIVGERMPMYDIKGNLSWGNWYTCNQCEFRTYAIEGHITQYRYCPNCGARMDGDEDEID